jgi:hypothetical protein
MNKSEITKNVMKNTANMVLQDALDILEADDGKSFDEKRDAVIKLLTQKGDTELSRLLSERTVADKTGVEIKTDFWKSGTVIPAGDTVYLRPVESNDRDSFLTIQRASPLVQSMEDKDSFLDLVWREHNEDKCLKLSIIKDGDYIGYCGIKDTTLPIWEIAIELLPAWTRHGIGFVALSTMLNEMESRLGITKYTVRIEPSNLASQKLFEKLGSIPSGIADIWFQEQTTIEKCEEAGLHLIDDNMIEVAKKFHVEPRQLLSHVLEYELIWDRKEGADGSV